MLSFTLFDANRTRSLWKKTHLEVFNFMSLYVIYIQIYGNPYKVTLESAHIDIFDYYLKILTLEQHVSEFLSRFCQKQPRKIKNFLFLCVINELVCVVRGSHARPFSALFLSCPSFPFAPKWAEALACLLIFLRILTNLQSASDHP